MNTSKIDNLFIVLICFEGREAKTEENFFKFISNLIKGETNVDIFRYFFNHSKNEQNINDIINCLQTIRRRLVSTSSSKKDIIFYIYHDWDDKKQHDILNSMFEFANQQIQKYFFDIPKINNKIFRIYDEDKSFDYFLYRLLHIDIDAEKIKGGDILQFIKKYNIKSEFSNYEKDLKEMLKQNYDSELSLLQKIIKGAIETKSNYSKFFEFINNYIYKNQ